MKKSIETEFGQRRCGFTKLSKEKLFVNGSLITNVSDPNMDPDPDPIRIQGFFMTKNLKNVQLNFLYKKMQFTYP